MRSPQLILHSPIFSDKHQTTFTASQGKIAVHQGRRRSSQCWGDAYMLLGVSIHSDGLWRNFYCCKRWHQVAPPAHCFGLNLPESLSGQNDVSRQKRATLLPQDISIGSTAPSQTRISNFLHESSQLEFEEERSDIAALFLYS